MRKMIQKFGLLLALLCLTAAPAMATSLSCGLDETAQAVDYVNDDGSQGSGGDGNDPTTGGFVVDTGYTPSGVSQITGIAFRACTSPTGGCTLTGPYYCSPLSNCSYYTLPNGHTLGDSSTYEDIGVWTVSTYVGGFSLGDSAPDPDGIDNRPFPAPSARVRMWYTKGTTPWNTSRTALCTDY